MWVQSIATNNPWEPPFSGLGVGEALPPFLMEKTGKSYGTPQQANGSVLQKQNLPIAQTTFYIIFIYLYSRKGKQQNPVVMTIDSKARLIAS